MTQIKDKSGKLFSTKKFTDDNTSSKILSTYRDQNIQLISKFKNILSYIDTLSQADDYEKNKIFGFFTSSWDVKWSNGAEGKNALEKIFHSLTYRLDEAIQLITNLIKELEEENAALTNYLGNLRPDQVDVRNEVSDMLISYAQRQHEIRSRLAELLPNIEKLEHSAIGYQDVMFKDMAASYTKTYNQFKELIKENKEVKYLFEAFSSLIEYLGKMINSQGKFLSTLDETSEEYTFAENFYNARRGNVLFGEVKGILQQLDGKSYSQADDKLKEKIDKFVANEIEPLFKGIKDGEEKLTFKLKVAKDQDKIKKLIDGDGEENPGFNQLISLLQTKISQSEEFGDVFAKGTIGNLILPTAGSKMRINSFINKYITKDDAKDRKQSIEKAVAYLKDLLNSENAFEQYMEIQKQNSAVTGIEGESKTSKKTKLDDEKIKNIKSDFNDVLKAVIHFLELLHADSINKDNYKDEATKLSRYIKLLYLEKYTSENKVQDFFRDFLEKTYLNKKITDIKAFYDAVKNSLDYLNGDYSEEVLQNGLFNNLRLISNILQRILK